MSLGLHTPLRPAWVCRADHLQWPCEQAQKRLLAQYLGNVRDLGLLMGSYLADARADMPDGQCGDLYWRMCAWYRGRR